MMKALPNDGGTLRDAIRNYERFTGQKHPDYPGAKPPIEMPRVALHIWNWFWEINTGRPLGMGASAIPPSEGLAGRELTGQMLDPWEVRALQRLDETFLRVQAEK